MGITKKFNQLRNIIGKNEHFERERKIPLFELVIALITAFSVCSKKKSIADIYRKFIELTKVKISRSSFWDRLTKEKLVNFLHKTILNFSFHFQEKALSKLSWLSAFKDIYLYDASPIRLPDKLAHKFPGNRKNHSPACFKLSALYQLSTRSVKWMKITAQKTHDSKILPALEQLKGALFLFDLGYFNHAFLKALCEAGVWFVCRLKKNSKPIITEVIKGVAKKNVGCRLDKNVNLRGAIVEVKAKLLIKSKKFVEARVIGFRFPKTKEYRWYVTNLPQTKLLADWIYPIYRLRWQIELFFKSIKTILNAEQVTSANENIALVCVYSSILASLIASSVLLEETIVLANIELKTITAQRIMIVFALIANDLANCLISNGITNIHMKNKIKLLSHLLKCPNSKHRPTSLGQVVSL